MSKLPQDDIYDEVAGIEQGDVLTVTTHADEMRVTATSDATAGVRHEQEVLKAPVVNGTTEYLLVAPESTALDPKLSYQGSALNDTDEKSVIPFAQSLIALEKESVDASKEQWIDAEMTAEAWLDGDIR